MFEVNSIITFKKPHNCGGFDWKVIRQGVDLKLECTTCGRVIEITRIKALTRIKK